MTTTTHPGLYRRDHLTTRRTECAMAPTVSVHHGNSVHQVAHGWRLGGMVEL
jgi:hypothetical protein